MHVACRNTGTNSRTSSGIDATNGNPQIIQTRRPELFRPCTSLRTFLLIEVSSMKSPRSPRTGISLGAVLLGTLILFAPSIRAAEHTPPAVQPATDFAAVEVHADEKLAIAAEPYDTREKMALFRVDYISHGVMPIRLIVTNNSDRPISLRDARILYVTPTGDRIQAAEPEDVERLMTRKEREGSKIPMPGPIPSIKLKPKASNKEIEQDFDTFEFQALVVEPHTTRAGFLFYDVSGLTHPLRGALLNLHTIKDADGKELFYFEIPFDKYLKTKSSQMN